MPMSPEPRADLALADIMPLLQLPIATLRKKIHEFGLDPRPSDQVRATRPIQKCPHGSIKFRCRACNEVPVFRTTGKRAGMRMGRYCVHGKRKDRCGTCDGRSMCEHRSERHRCKWCGTKSVCEHRREKRRCRPCNIANRNVVFVRYVKSASRAVPRWTETELIYRCGFVDDVLSQFL